MFTAIFLRLSSSNTEDHFSRKVGEVLQSGNVFSTSAYRFRAETIEHINEILRSQIATGTSSIGTSTQTSNTGVNRANTHLKMVTWFEK